MPPVVRRIVAVITGCAVGLFIMYLLHALADQISPLPRQLDPFNRQQVQVAFEAGKITTTYVILVLSGWLLGAYGGGAIASRLGRSRAAGLIFAMVFTAVVVAELNLMWHPTWMWVAGAAGAPLIALGAAGESITVG